MAQQLKVIQWATGGVGKAAIECVINHPELELAGCWVYSSTKNGRDVGEILGADPLGVTASYSIDDVLALDADCVMYSPLVANDDEVKAILRSGRCTSTPIAVHRQNAHGRNEVKQQKQPGSTPLRGSPTQISGPLTSCDASCLMRDTCDVI